MQARDFAAKFRRKMQYSLFRQHWNLAVTPYAAPVVAGLEGAVKQRQALTELSWMPERRDAFAADPMIVADHMQSGAFLVYYEHFPWQEGRGTIRYARFRNGQFEPSMPVLETPHHLSYPFILDVDGQPAMIPEHSESRDLSYYPLDRSGSVAGKVTIGQDMPFVDSTIVQWRDRFWLFATQAGRDDNLVLYIYHADRVGGPWTAHRQNPVKTDLGNARPAGPLFEHRGALFRPAQDCRAYYGAGIVINEVLQLTEDSFEERPVSDIRPLANSSHHYGLHTISSADGHTAIDGARMNSIVHPMFDRFGPLLKS